MYSIDIDFNNVYSEAYAPSTHTRQEFCPKQVQKRRQLTLHASKQRRERGCLRWQEPTEQKLLFVGDVAKDLLARQTKVPEPSVTQTCFGEGLFFFTGCARWGPNTHVLNQKKSPKLPGIGLTSSNAGWLVRVANLRVLDF